jgi:hypothetical protein
MGLKANWSVIQANKDWVIIRDLGPWDQYKTITNAVEFVVENISRYLDGRQLFYYDSSGQLDEIVIEDGKFDRFKAGGPEGWNA